MDTYKVNKLIEKYNLPYKVGYFKHKKYGYFSCLYWVDANGRQGVVCANPGRATYKPLIDELSKVGPAGQALVKEFNDIYRNEMMYGYNLNLGN